MLGKAIFGRITRSYVDISGIFTEWSKNSRVFVLYEHEADEEINRTHCHFVLWDNTDTVKKIKERNNYKQFKFARSDHSWKELEWIDEKDPIKVCVYMAKGNLDAKATNLPSIMLDYFKQEWKQGKQKKKDYFDICMEIREQCTYECSIECRDEFGYPQIRLVRAMRNFDEVYNMLMVKLDEERVRTNEMDIERWLLTIMRNDSRLGDETRKRLKNKFSP